MEKALEPNSADRLRVSYCVTTWLHG